MPAQDWNRLGKNKRFKGSVDANAIPIGVIVSNYGGEVREGRAVSVRCCLHNDTRRSAVINTLDNLYFCHTCGKGGNAVNLVCLLDNLEFKDCLKRAVEIATRSGAEIRTGNNSRGARRARRTWNL